jgi:hypothetical protein
MERDNQESHLLYNILLTWGAHPMLRIWRVNTGVGWFADGKPARNTDRGAYPVKFGVSGQADISGLLLPNGRRLEIETKTIKGRQSKEQAAWQRLTECFGGLYVLARSVGDVDRALAEIGVTR